jgi:hypothetical protein
MTRMTRRFSIVASSGLSTEGLMVPALCQCWMATSPMVLAALTWLVTAIRMMSGRWRW